MLDGPQVGTFPRGTACVIARPGVGATEPGTLARRARRVIDWLPPQKSGQVLVFAWRNTTNVQLTADVETYSDPVDAVVMVLSWCIDSDHHVSNSETTEQAANVQTRLLALVSTQPVLHMVT